MHQEVLDGRYAPITSQIGFVECAPDVTARAFQDWIGPIQAKCGARLTCGTVSGAIEERLTALLPLTNIEPRRLLFQPTASQWTAYFDNGWRGTDVVSAVPHLVSIIKCRGIRAVSVRHTLTGRGKDARGRYGGTIFELYSSDSFARRSICVVNDGGRRSFDAGGLPLEFEQTERYTARRVRERFTPDLLAQYLSHFGIDFFSREFYSVAQPEYLISKVGPRFPGSRDYSLEESRCRRG